MVEPAIFPINRATHWGAARALCDEARDYVELETRRAPDDGFVANFFDETPPGFGPDALVHLGAGRPDRLDGMIAACRGYNSADSWWMALILLSPRARGTGLGRAMVAHLAGLARQGGARWIKLAVLSVNAPARAFYGHLGFEHERDAPATPDGDGHDRIVLKLDLERFHAA